MGNTINRRKLIAGMGALTAGAIGVGPRMTRQASAAEGLVAVEWGPPYIDATKKVLETYSGPPISWTLHQGGAALIVAKIKASWPNPEFDLVDMWSPVFLSCLREGWLEPISISDVPNLASVPPSFIVKDAAGNFMCAPRDLAVTCFAARADTVPIKIQSLHDLYRPELKGQIAWPNVGLNAGEQIVNLALANGGDEHNIEPGWTALKELAKTGNIGRIVATSADVINTLSSGETSVTFADLITLSGVSAHFPMTYFTKTDPSLKSFLAVEGWVVLKSSKNKKAAFDLINFLISPENETAFCAQTKTPPPSTKAKVLPGLEHAQFSTEEATKFAYIPDYVLMGRQLDSWQKRFESEIVPLIRG